MSTLPLKSFVCVLIALLTAGILSAQVGPFAERQVLTGAPRGNLVGAGDFNGDGRLDLLLRFEEYIWYLGAGEGTFRARLTTSANVGSGHNHIDLVDLDGDGDLDILYLNDREQQMGAWFSRDRRGNYDHRILGSAPNAIGDAAAGDLDGDGDIDVVYTDRDDHLVFLLRNQGRGTFDEPEILAEANGQPGKLPGAPFPVVLGDFNGDGRVDIAGKSPGTAELWELRNTRTGFTPRRLMTTPVGNIARWAMHAADVDDDGDDDIVYGARRVFGQLNSEMVGFVKMRNGTGTLQEVFTTTQRDHRYRMVLGDFDADGDLDLVRNGEDLEGLYYHRFHRGAFEFSEEIEAPDGDPVMPLPQALDIDGDGDPDMMAEVGGPGTAFFENLTKNEAIINSFTTSRDQIREGESVTLRWDVVLADRIILDPGIGNVGTRRTQVVRPTETTEYTLRVVRGATEVRATLTVEVFGDSDGDGMEDEWEQTHFNSLERDGTEDADSDGLSDLEEFENDTDPNATDSDGDGLGDAGEVNVHQSDPAQKDSDEDGVDDWLEVAAGSDPDDGDSRPSALVNGLQIYSRFDELNAAGAVPNLAQPDVAGRREGVAVLGATGILGEALQLTGGAGNGVSYPQIEVPGNGDFSVSFWFRPEAAAEGVLVANADEAGTTEWSVHLLDGSLEFRVGFESFRLEDVQEDAWNHVVLVVEGAAAVARAGLNGEVSDEVAITSGSLRGAIGTVTVGAAPEAPFVLGLFDELAVWGRALTTNEMAALPVAPTLNLSVVGAAGPAALPEIAVQPAGGQKFSGQALELSVEATGLAPVWYEWRKDGDLLDGEEGPTLTLGELDEDDSGSYVVTIHNVAGAVQSESVPVTVLAPTPRFVTSLTAEGSRREFGLWADLCGDLLAVGDPVDSFSQPSVTGAVYLYRRDEGGASNWGQIARITPPEQAIAPHGFGNRIAVDRNRIAIGCSSNRERRSEVFIYEVRNNTPVLQAVIPDHRDDESFGVHLDLFGDTLVVSAWNGGEGRTLNGRVHVYQRQDDSSWEHQRMIIASATTLDDHYGISVALGEDVLAVGAKDDWDGERESGAVYVYERNRGGPNRWGELQKLKGSANIRFGTFGSAVSISGTTIAVGAHLTQSETFVDYVFERSGPGRVFVERSRNQFILGDWVRSRSQESISVSGDHFVSVDSESEKFFIHRRDQGGRDRWGLVKDAVSPPLKQFEQSVALSGSAIFVGPDSIFEQPAVAPSVKHHPQARTARQGEQAIFSVYAVGSPPLAVQWLKDGEELPGATGDELLIEAVGPEDPGRYQARITNEFGSILSREVLLESDVPAAIVSQPSAPVREDDGMFVFSIEVEGSFVEVQWFKNGDPIPGANETVLRLEDPNFSDAAVYYVEVWNELRRVTSEEVELSLEEMMPLELAKFRPGSGGRQAGRSVDLFGTLAIVGAPNTDPLGAAYIYEFDEAQGSWSLVEELRPPVGEGRNDSFGEAVAITDEIAVVGAPRTFAPANLDAGAVYVFRRVAGTNNWVRETTLPRDGLPDRQGKQLAISGGDIFVGALGTIHHYQRRESRWILRATLERPGTGGLGNSLAVQNDILVAGAPFDSTHAEFSGSVFVFEQSPPGSGQWVERAELFSDQPAEDQKFGNSIALYEGTIAVGSQPRLDLGTVYLFEQSGGTWNFVEKVLPADAQRGDGVELALEGNQLLLGASGDDSRGTESGAVYLFEKGADGWEEVQKIQAFDAESGAAFGLALDLESGNALVGAIRTEGPGGAYLLRVSPSLLSVSSEGLASFNPQTGLYEQHVIVRNESTETVPAMEILLHDLPEGVHLFNGSGEESVHFESALAGLGSVTMTLEFYVPTRVAPTAPFFSVGTAVAREEPPTEGDFWQIDLVRKMEDGGMLIEFPTKIGSRYRVQYSSDMKDWKDVHPLVRAAGSRVQWYDQGAPKTETHPSEHANRWYRVVELPNSENESE